MKSVTRIRPHAFEVTTYTAFTARDGYTGYNESKLQLDFTLVIEELSEEEKSYPYKLIHWQAQPKGDREWGVYNSVDDSYICSVFKDHDALYGGAKLIMIDDSSSLIPTPSSVIYFVGSFPLVRSTFSDVSSSEVSYTPPS